MLFQWLVVASIAGLVVTSVLHSIGGEIYLLRPLFKHRGNRVLDHQLATEETEGEEEEDL